MALPWPRRSFDGDVNEPRESSPKPSPTTSTPATRAWPCWPKESRCAYETAGALAYVEIDASLVDRLDRIAATTWKLSR